MQSVGIIGFGSFGEFLAEKLESFVSVRISSRRPEAVPERWRATLEEVAACEYIIPSIPLDTYERVLEKIKPSLSSHSVIVDVCSVKVKPVEIIRHTLPDVKIVATHPLFGPQSAEHSLAGHTFVVCPDVSDPDALSVVARFAASLGLDVVSKTADEHDREMALVHALTFFIAQGLVQMDLHNVDLKTPSFERLVRLAELERNHSEDLFRTIQHGNPYAAEIRQRFLSELQKIDTAV